MATRMTVDTTAIRARHPHHFGRPSRSRQFVLAMGIAAVLLLLTSCGESTPPQTPLETSPSSAAFPVTIDAANATVTIDQRPERIVSLSPSATEMLFAIGAGDQVAAVDDEPVELPDLDRAAARRRREEIIEREGQHGRRSSRVAAAVAAGVLLVAGLFAVTRARWTDDDPAAPVGPADNALVGIDPVSGS